MNFSPEIQAKQDALDAAASRRLNIQFVLTCVGFIVVGILALAAGQPIEGIG